jgi:hypothetical protein
MAPDRLQTHAGPDARPGTNQYKLATRHQSTLTNIIQRSRRTLAGQPSKPWSAFSQPRYISKRSTTRPHHALAGRAVLRDGRAQESLRLGLGEQVWHPAGLIQGLPHDSPGAEPHDARAGSVEGCPWAAAWSGCARPTGCHRAPTCKICECLAPSRSWSRNTLQGIRCSATGHTADRSPRTKISWPTSVATVS